MLQSFNPWMKPQILSNSVRDKNETYVRNIALPFTHYGPASRMRPMMIALCSGCVRKF